ncbi:acyl-CoA dehydrogenase family protein [Peribacillus simplex]|uniref:acyl-CoA dehydrogenase family protein n=1 Tax=Peribacillus simplex TaxID=1478 RepID=UPI001D7B4FAA|nr:acyl-CoA dehydrogenase family protein [Peribacillus simplex]MED3983167.1 acyl-CoA dehydrogenase family protein [Peribacillus simplex]MED4095289.1 acyl-CoA dehydrogenase family protein [Peribacillus simplex]CAH0212975.1 putative acyl-CoA dehydrogenase [Peribacillus simplex]
MLTVKKELKHFLNTDILPDEIFTPEDFSDEHIMLEEMTEKFVKNRVYPALGNIENQEFDETVRLIKEAGELGLISADIPEQDGGLELGKVSASIISEKMALGRSFSITFGGQTGIGALPIAYFGTEKQKEMYLPKMLTGETIAAYALTEPSSGTDAMSAKTTAVLSKCGTYYILNGEKQWISNSSIAAIFIVYAKVKGEKFTAFIIEKGYEGVSISPEEKKMGLRGSSTCSLILDNVRVPSENVIGEVGRGHIIAFNVLNIGRHKISATSLGTAKRSIELAVSYANERKQFGKPISSFNLIKNKLADMAIKTYANESSVYRTAGAMQEGFENMKQIGSADFGETTARYALACSINKVMSTEVLDFIVDEALQIHGGYGYMEEYEIETLYRDSRVNRIFEGTNEINRTLIASTLLKAYELPSKKGNVDEGKLLREKQTLQLMKNLYHSTIEAVRKNGLTNLNQEQETAAFIADLVIGIYSAESSILRTEKAVQVTGEDKNSQKIAYTKVFIHETSQSVAIRALNILNHLGDDEVFSRIAGRLIMSSPEDIVEVKRRIADVIIEAEKYVS